MIWKKIYYFSIVLLCSDIYLHCSSAITPQDSCFGTLEISELTRDVFSFIKDMNEHYSKRLNNMSLLILQLIIHYI